jgi:hypothetical protein
MESCISMKYVWHTLVTLVRSWYVFLLNQISVHTTYQLNKRKAIGSDLSKFH